MSGKITEHRKTGHSRPVAMLRVCSSPSGLDGGHVGLGKRRLDQNVGTIDSRIQKTHSRHSDTRPFCSLRQCLGNRPLRVSIQFLQKIRWTVTRTAKLYDRQSRKQDQLDYRPVRQHRKHDMLRKIQAIFTIPRASPQPLDQIFQILFMATYAPYFPPHRLARRWKPRRIVCPERLQARLANGLDGLDEILAPRFSRGGELAFLIFTQDLRKHLTRFIRNVHADDARVVRFAPGGSARNPVLLSFNDFDPRSAFQL